MRQPSKERGCDGKMKLGKNPFKKARKMAIKHGKKYGVYNCRYCLGQHLTTKLKTKDEYAPLVYITE